MANVTASTYTQSAHSCCSQHKRQISTFDLHELLHFSECVPFSLHSLSTSFLFESLGYFFILSVYLNVIFAFRMKNKKFVCFHWR